ncbi:DUF4160 domain-containing protein [Methylomonas sp. HW2-6]|uniref:DUF4160 domain-containing protein n=1 Tax=Methylomonas sp. HW2-6 TaxID=3376687 RepID=UPI00404392F5
MSPTVFKEAGFRFYFFSREEPRMHVHVQAQNGEAKFLVGPRHRFGATYRFVSQNS